MTHNLTGISGIGESLAEKMKRSGINSIEKLASIKIQDLLKIKGIGKVTGQKYIETAKKILKKKGEHKNRGILNEELLLEDHQFPEKTFTPIEKPPINHDIKLKKIPPLPKINYNQESIDDMSKEEKLEKKPYKNRSYHEKTVGSKEKDLFMNNLLLKETPLKPHMSFKQKSPNITSKKEQIKPNFSNKKFYPEKKVPKKVKRQVKKNYPSRKKPTKPKSISKQKKYNENTVKKVKTERTSTIQTFFQEDTMHRIRGLHSKIINLEKILSKQNKSILLEELNYILEYVKILNVNYKNHSQIKILKELDITPSFYDPLEIRRIKIWDLVFECARVLWVSARLYSYISAKYEADNKIKYAIAAMVECSKMYKTAAYFSAACTRQEDLGSSLSVENLENKSEEARIFAQNIATRWEAKKENLSLASHMYAGLSTLSRRLYYLKNYGDIKEKQLKAQINYDMGNACHLKAKYLIKISKFYENNKDIEEYKKKANHYFHKAENIWENMRKNEYNNLLKNELENLNYNLSVVNEKIIENDVGITDYSEIKKIQDPEPIIIIPENLAHFLPRCTINLTKYGFRNLEFKRFEEYKKIRSEMNFQTENIDNLLNKKAGIGRTIQELKGLYENNDIDINKYAKLLEKYSIKLFTLENVIENLRKSDDKDNVKEKERNKRLIRSLTQNF